MIDEAKIDQANQLQAMCEGIGYKIVAVSDGEVELESIYPTEEKQEAARRLRKMMNRESRRAYLQRKGIFTCA